MARKEEKTPLNIDDTPKKLTERKSKASIDAGLYSFINIVRFHNIPADPEQITHALAIGKDGMGELDILRAAKEFKHRDA